MVPLRLCDCEHPFYNRGVRYPGWPVGLVCCPYCYGFRLFEPSAAA